MAITCSGFALRGAGRSSKHTGERPSSPKVGVSRSRGRICPDCGRVFPNKRGPGVHRSAHHPGQVNAERLREEDRRPAGATEPPPSTRPRSSRWTEEDRIFIRRYLKFNSNGRAVGYSAFVALELPRNTERQVRDSLVPLLDYRYPYGLIDAPELPAPHPQSPGLASTRTSPRRDMTSPEGHDSTGDPGGDFTQTAGQRVGAPGTDNTPGTWTGNAFQERTETTTWGLFPGVASRGGFRPRQVHWQNVLDEILGTEPVGRVGARLKELAALEGDIQVRLDELVEELQVAMVATQPVVARARRPANPTSGRSERTRRKVTRYARTQDMCKKNPSCLAELVLKHELGDLMADGPRVTPPKRETLELYRGMWGAPVDSTLSLQGVGRVCGVLHRGRA
ncbi:hypothetical protein J6590_088892 [Homalodisca vitripennis]|nr:hypothetical protein J6590_088892 [Homalodisca vitripennis]